MNHKQLAEDHYETSQHVTNSDIAARHVARAQYHATMAQLEAIDGITALLSPVNDSNSVSLEQLRKADRMTGSFGLLSEEDDLAHYGDDYRDAQKYEEVGA